MTMAMPSGDDRPAIDGGQPVFPDGLPLARPAIANPSSVAEAATEILASGVLTNGPYVRRLEERAAAYLGVRHCVAVCSCTAGLMLVLRASGLSGDVVLPSFTFSASAHAVAWNGLRRRSPTSAMTPAPRPVRRGPLGRGQDLGHPGHRHLRHACDTEALGRLARRNGIRLFFDAAHAFGSRRGDQMVGGFGDAEVFSLSPTKVLIAGEGGRRHERRQPGRALPDRPRLRQPGRLRHPLRRPQRPHVRAARRHRPRLLRGPGGTHRPRNQLAERYRKVLAGLGGIDFPVVAEGDRSTYKDFTILIDAEGFGMDATEVAGALAAEGVQTRRYYAPPVHRQRAYRWVGPANGALPETDRAAARVLTLPLWTGMDDEQVDGVGAAMARLHGRQGRG